MEYTTLVEQIRTQWEALHAAAVKAGPQAPVPTCPGWTVHQLVEHITRVQAWATVNLRTAPDAPRPEFPVAPQHWGDLIVWGDQRRAALVERLTSTPPDTPAWVFPGIAERTVRFWARRQAHETAIHRLDAEHALAGTASAQAVPTLLFDTEFAADGIDELLGMAQALTRFRGATEVTGRALFHAADAGRAWEVRLAAGKPPEVGPADDAATEADVTVAGTADAVYRAVWGRPSTAVVTGDAAVLAGLRAP